MRDWNKTLQHRLSATLNQHWFNVPFLLSYYSLSIKSSVKSRVKLLDKLGEPFTDYCNSILYNIPNREINKVQSIQNWLARVVTRSSRLCSVIPLLNSLHWLPVQFRIKYKICTLTFKVIHSCQPVYLHNLLKPLNRTRNLRYSDDDQLVVPRVSSRWVKGLFRLRPPNSGILSLLRLKNLNLHSHFGKNWRLYISVKPFHPKSSVSRHAGSTNWNVKRTMVIEPDSDLQSLWARDTEDLGALEVFHFISFHFIWIFQDNSNPVQNQNWLQ